MQATSNAARVDTALIQVEPKPTEQQIVDLESIKRSRKRRKIDNWFAAILIVAVCVFAGAVAVFILNPVISTLATSAQEWTPEGP